MKTKLIRSLMTFVILGLVLGALALPSPVYAATYVVNTTDQTIDFGTAPCDARHCSLWEAIIMANMHSGPDRITFNLPGAGPHIIYYGTPEGRTFDWSEIVDDETEIDGTTQPGWPVYLHGLGEAGWPLILRSNRNTIRGLGFLGFNEHGLFVARGSEHNFIDRVVVGDYLGGGMILAPLGNATGITLYGDNNVVSGASVGNNDVGIAVLASNNVVRDSRIGFLSGSSTRRGNVTGINIVGEGNTIERNTVLGNSYYGIRSQYRGSIIRNNWIGVDSSGLHPWGNHFGISLEGRGYNRIGGMDLYDGNVIVANDVGIVIRSPGNQLINNRIGTDFDGAAIPNGNGVQIFSGSDGTILGGGWLGNGNVIAYNTGEGIVVSDASQINIVGNTIFGNGGHGIALQASEGPPPAEGMRVEISLNSIYDNGGQGIYIPDASFNHSVEYPAGLRFTGSAVTGRACPGCTVEVFVAAADPSGFGEGKTFLESGTAGTDGSFSIPIAGLRACSQITATATDVLGNTSVFSQNANALLCLRTSALMAWIIIIGGAGAGAGAALLVVTRRRPLTLRNAPWLLLGIALGIGVAVLLLRLPFVQIAWPSQGGQVPPTQAPAASTAPSQRASETPTVILQAQPSITPTVTLTTTPTSSAPAATLLQNAYCRRGPGTDYDSVTTLPAGLNVPIVGRNQNRTWWQVQVPGTQTQCWLADGNVETSGDTSQVPVIEVEPLGCWVKQQQGPDKCIAPCPQGAQPGGACEP